MKWAGPVFTITQWRPILVLATHKSTPSSRFATMMEELFRRLADLDDAVIGEGSFSPGPAVWVGTREVAHGDNDQTLDVRLTKKVIRGRRSGLQGDARIALRSASSDWLEVRVESAADVEFAVLLVRDAIAANLAGAPPGSPPTGAELERRRRFH